MKSMIVTKTSVASSSVPCCRKNADIAMLIIATHIPKPMIRIAANISISHLLRATIAAAFLTMT
jgi:hypothetical protein